MRKILFSILLLTMLLETQITANNIENVFTQTNVETPIITENADWKPLIDAIIYIESKGNPNAINEDGKSYGILQITPICVKDCNRIIKKEKYKLNDRFDITKSLEMFMIIQNYYNPERNIEKAIRIWNGGPTYSIKHTQNYYNKVISKYNEIKSGK